MGTPRVASLDDRLNLRGRARHGHQVRQPTVQAVVVLVDNGVCEPVEDHVGPECPLDLVSELCYGACRGDTHTGCGTWRIITSAVRSICSSVLYTCGENRTAPARTAARMPASANAARTFSASSTSTLRSVPAAQAAWSLRKSPRQSHGLAQYARLTPLGQQRQRFARSDPGEPCQPCRRSAPRARCRADHRNSARMERCCSASWRARAPDRPNCDGATYRKLALLAARQQVLVSSARQVVDLLQAPAKLDERHRVCGIYQRARTHPSRGLQHIVKRSRASGMRLDQAPGHQRGRRRHRLGQTLQRHHLDVHTAFARRYQDREQQRGEFVVWNDHGVSRAQPGSNRGHAHRHRWNQRHALSRSIDQLRESRAAHLTALVPILDPVGCACLPFVDGAVHGRHRRARRQSVCSRIEVDRAWLGIERCAGSGKWRPRR